MIEYLISVGPTLYIFYALILAGIGQLCLLAKLSWLVCVAVSMVGVAVIVAAVVVLIIGVIVVVVICLCRRSQLPR